MSCNLSILRTRYGGLSYVIVLGPSCRSGQFRQCGPLDAACVITNDWAAPARAVQRRGVAWRGADCVRRLQAGHQHKHGQCSSAVDGTDGVDGAADPEQTSLEGCE